MGTVCRAPLQVDPAIDDAEQELGDGISTPGSPGSLRGRAMGASGRPHLALVGAVGDVDPANERRVARTAVASASRSPSRISCSFGRRGRILELMTLDLWIRRWTVGLSCGALVLPLPGRTAGSRRSR